MAAKFTAGYLALVGMAVAAQSLTRVYQSDLNGTDESSHYVNGLMVHDYLADKLPGNPIDYAVRYYIHFPKVGIGHWPPLYYFIESTFFFLIRPSIGAALFLEAVLAAAVAATVGWVVGRLGGWIPAVMGSLVTLAAPYMLLGIQGDMLDVPIAFTALLAMLAWARFLLEERWIWSAAFALIAAGTILIKGNGICLALFPPLSIVLCNRPRLLRNWRFWLPLPIVAVLTAPWYLLTYKFTARGFNYSWGAAYVLAAAPAYSRLLIAQIGIAGLALAIIGAVNNIRSREHSWRRMLTTSALSLVFAGLIFHSVVPVDIDGRYLTLVVPALVILAYLGVEALVALRPPVVRAFLTMLSFGVILATAAVVHDKATRAMDGAAKLIFDANQQSPFGRDNCFVLIGSTTGGEGAFTAEMAALDRKRVTYVVRGFRVLGSGNFNGTDYAPRFDTAEHMADWIRANGIGWVVIDRSPQSLRWKHNAELEQIAESDRQDWSVAGRFASSFGETVIYRVSNAGAPKDHAGLLSELAPRNVVGRDRHLGQSGDR